MNPALDRLYELLPVIHRLRDAEQEPGEPLHALLQVIAEQVNVVEDNIGQLYENWFIETCQDWVVPYIGDLVGYVPVHDVGEPLRATLPPDPTLARILIPRREVANTIRYRRRKGALALLEELARDVAGWPARAVEFYRLLGWTQPRFAIYLRRGRTVDLRDGDALDRLRGAFDELAHRVDVRRISAPDVPQGRYNIPSVGLFVWRLRNYSVTETSAYCLEDAGPHCYTFSVLGNDTPLYNKPEPEPAPEHIAGERNVPAPIRRLAFEERRHEGGEEQLQASTAYYGEGKSLAIWAPDWPAKGAEQPIPAAAIVPADLSGWKYVAQKGTAAVDPVLGRIAFPKGQLPRKGVLVSYQYGFSHDMGGGEYSRLLQQPASATVYHVPTTEYPTINAALAQWYAGQREGGVKDAVIEIDRSGVYVEQLSIPDPDEPAPLRAIQLAPGSSLQLRAANGARPILRLLDYQTGSPDALTVLFSPGSRFTLDGLLITGRGVHVESLPLEPPEPVGPAEDEKERQEQERQEQEPPEAVTEEEPFSDDQTSTEGCVEELAGGPASAPARLHIRHCTLVPGWTLQGDCSPGYPAEPSLELWNVDVHVTVAHSILGSIQVYQDEVLTDPIPIHISDSILDATGTGCEGPECEALSAPGSGLAHAVLTALRCTVIGHVLTHAIDLAENSILDGQVWVARSQRGCGRFSYVRPGSRTPRRYRCQPDLAGQAKVKELRRKTEEEKTTPPTELEEEHAQRWEEERVRPQFNSTRYGTPTYCQLADTCAEEIRHGAEDESEMGTFHDLYQPQREANLRARLAEYSPAGMDAGIIYAS